MIVQWSVALVAVFVMAASGIVATHAPESLVRVRPRKR
jgi:hypothetical protein